MTRRTIHVRPETIFPALGRDVPPMMKADIPEQGGGELLVYLEQWHAEVLGDVAFLEIKAFAPTRHGGSSWYQVVAPRQSLDNYEQVVRGLVDREHGATMHYSVGKNSEFLAANQIILIPVDRPDDRVEGGRGWAGKAYDLEHLQSDSYLRESSLDEALEEFRRLFDAAEGTLTTQSGAPLAAVVCCNLITTGEVESAVSQIFLGVGADSLEIGADVRLRWQVSNLLGDLMLLIYRSLSAPVGKRTQQMQFAHQMSRVTDALAEQVSRLPAAVQRELGPLLIANFHILRATVNSYREAASQVDAGPFPGGWGEDEDPMPTYRDIAIMLGLARCEDAPDDRVKAEGLISRQADSQIGAPTFKLYQTFCRLSGEVPRWTLPFLRHSHFAVLVSLAISQAYYHTVRARVAAHGAGRTPDEDAFTSVHVAADDLTGVITCLIDNPTFDGADEASDPSALASKDVGELMMLAATLSTDQRRARNTGLGAYQSTGPVFDPESRRWHTTITCETRHG